jgi:hypothetical protein
MAFDIGATVRFDHQGTWPASFRAQERMMLATQAKYDRSRIPAVWYWRLLRQEDRGGTAPHEVFAEAARANRRYAQPVAVYLFCDDSSIQKGLKKGIVELTDLAKIGWSRAEARRIGKLVQSADAPEGLYEEPSGELIFVPRAEDVFLFRGQFFYEVMQVKQEFLGQTPIVSVWKGTANLLRADSTAPGMPELPPAPTPVPPEILPWRRNGSG